MNGLVDYGSSDEEETISPLRATSERDTSTSYEVAKDPANPDIPAVEDRRGENSEGTSGNSSSDSTIGPRPLTDNGNGNRNFETELSPSLLSMSEIDLLRHLTQPTHPNASLPSAPASPADPETTAKFKQFLKLKQKGSHFNKDLASRSTFRNPNLFAMLLDRAGLSADDQYLNTLQADLVAPAMPSWAFKEELLKHHQSRDAVLAATKRTQAASGKRTVDFVSGSNGTLPAAQPKRKRP